MKKLSYLFLVAFMVFAALTGCDNTDDEEYSEYSCGCEGGSGFMHENISAPSSTSAKSEISQTCLTELGPPCDCTCL